MEEVITISKINSTDWQEYKTIRLEALQNEPKAYRHTFAQAKQYTEDKWREDLSRRNACVYIAKNQEKIIGMIGCYEENDDTAVIWGVYLNNIYRGKGIGERLFHSIIEEIKNRSNIHIIKLWVEDEQKAAFALYNKVGFHIVEKENEHLFIMELDIKKYI